MSAQQHPVVDTNRKVGSAVRMPADRIVLVFLGLFFLIHGALYRLQVDDAFISYRYAWNWIHGNGLVFNPGEAVEGYSNFLWVILLGIAGLSGLDISTCGIILSFLSTIWMIVEFRRLEIELADETSSPGSIRLWLLGASGVTAAWMFAGMEGPFYMAVQIRLIRCLAASRWIEGGLLAGAVGMIRLEGGFIGLPVTLWFLLKQPAAVRLKCAWRALGPAALVYGGYMSWRWSYFGQWIPNVVRAKLGLAPWEAFRQGAGYLWTQGWPWLVIISVCLVYSRLTGSECSASPGSVRGTPVLMGLTAFGVLLILGSGGDWMAGGRYFLFLLPWLLLLLPVENGERTRERAQPPGLQLVLVLILVGHSLFSPTMWPLAEAMREQVTGLRIAGQWLSRHVDAGFRLAIRPCGALAYETIGHHCIDMFGLTDRRIAEEGPKDPLGTPGHVSRWDDDVARRQPEVIVPGGAGFFSLPVYHVEEPFRENYQAVVLRFPEVEGRFGQFLLLLVRQDRVQPLQRKWLAEDEFHRVIPAENMVN